MEFIWCFPHDSTWLWVWGRKTIFITSGKAPLSLHQSKVYAINVSYHCWCWPWLLGWRSVRFIHCKVTLFFPLPILCSLEISHYVWPLLKEWGILLHFFEGWSIYIMIWNSSTRDISLFFPIYPVICLYQYVLINTYFKHYFIYFVAFSF